MYGYLELLLETDVWLLCYYCLPLNKLDTNYIIRVIKFLGFAKLPMIICESNKYCINKHIIERLQSRSVTSIDLYLFAINFTERNKNVPKYLDKNLQFILFVVLNQKLNDNLIYVLIKECFGLKPIGCSCPNC